jgi:hypothetical protein
MKPKKENEEKIKELVENNKNLNILQPQKNFPMLGTVQIKWDEDLKVRYFSPPRFLIVEDNVFGRNNLIDILKKQKLNFLIDIAAYGHEAVQKYRFFLRKGYLIILIHLDLYTILFSWILIWPKC